MPKKAIILRLSLATAICSLCGICLILAGCFLFLSPKLPPVSQLQDVQLQIPLRIFSKDGKLIAKFGEKRRSPINHDEIPQDFINAILAAEDNRFYEHHGVDFKGLGRAFYELLRYQSIRTGGSTITMQVARNFFLGKEQKFLRKFNEIILATQIERHLSKEQILELYINKIYLGHRAYGIVAASEVYYGKNITELSLAQLAMIAGLPKAPSSYNPITNPERAQQRRDWILGRMLKHSYITQEQHDTNINEVVTAKYHGLRREVEAPYLAEMVRSFAFEQYGEKAYTQGYKIFTTIPSTLQKNANKAVINGIYAYEERHGYRGAEATADLSFLDPITLNNIEQDEKISNTTTQTQENQEELDTAASEAKILSETEAWQNTLSGYKNIGGLTPAVITKVNDQNAAAILKNGKTITLEWDAISWARPFINVNSIGKKPSSTADVLKIGDIVRIYIINYHIIEKSITSQLPIFASSNKIVKNIITTFEIKKPIWRLGQIPRVQSAFIAIDPQNGAVQALVGGFNFTQSKYNRVIQGGRQPGSVFKPFIYTAALEQGLTPSTIINDAPIVFNDGNLETVWRPTGAGSKFYGPTRLRKALYKSLNLVSIRLLRKVSISTAIDSIVRFGISKEKLPEDLSLALGSASITPWEIATAYTALANGGFKIEPHFIQRIEDNEENILFENSPLTVCLDCEKITNPDDAEKIKDASIEESGNDIISDDDLFAALNGGSNKPKETTFPVAPRIIEERVAWQMNSLLQDVIKRGTGQKALALRRSDIAGKTGTTNEQVDAWFSGYNPDLVATAWLGFDDPSTLGRREYGGVAALPIWLGFMKEALKNKKEKLPKQPDGLITIRIDPDTGERALPGQANAIFETFREEFVPEKKVGSERSGTNTSSYKDDIHPEQLF